MCIHMYMMITLCVCNLMQYWLIYFVFNVHLVKDILLCKLTEVKQTRMYIYLFYAALAHTAITLLNSTEAIACDHYFYSALTYDPSYALYLLCAFCGFSFLLLSAHFE